MRLPAWVALTGSVCLLLVVGALGVEMNRAAVRTAENVHRADALALAANDRSLIHQYVRQSAQDLIQTLALYTPSLRPGDAEDVEALRRLVGRSAFFRFGAALTDSAGRVLTQATGARALPRPDDPAFRTLFDAVAGGDTGASGVLVGGDTPVVAIGVPVTVDGTVRGALVGFSNLRSSLMQGFILQLSDDSTRVGIVDSRGNTVADSDQTRIGQPVDPAIAGGLRSAAATPTIMEYRDGDRPMVAVLVSGLPGGWTFYQAQPVAAFYGPVRSHSTGMNLVLLVLVLVALLSLTFLGHRVTAANRRAEARFVALVQNATDLITVLDRDGLISFDSPSIAGALGYPGGARIGRPVLAFVHPDDRAAVRDSLERLPLRAGAIDRFECRLRRADRSYVWVDMSALNLLHDPAIRGVVVNGRDVSDQRELQDQLSYQAQHDPLTGLPNRQVFSERLRAAVLGGRKISVLFIDLDRFKWVNDEWGHDVGDDLLRRVGRRLGRCVRSHDTLARVGGDEFVILLDGVRDESEALRVAERIVASMSEPFPMPGGSVRIGASVGISTSVPGTPLADAEDLIRAADSAMYRAKQAGGLGYRVAPASATA